MKNKFFNKQSSRKPLQRIVSDKVGAVVVHHGSWENTARCVASLKAGTIVPRIVVLDNDVNNRGYGKACNEGFRLLDCEKVIFMNNDTVVDKKMVEMLYKSELDYCCPVIKNKKGEITYSGGDIKRSGPNHWTTEWHGDVVTAFLQGACICVKKEKWIRFDESLFLYFEDVELSMRARYNGMIMGVVHNALLMHDCVENPMKRYWTARNYRSVMGNDFYYFTWWIPKRVVFFLLAGRWEELKQTIRGMIDGLYRKY